MTITRQIKAMLEHPQLRGLDLDAVETTRIRSRVIQEKSFLKQLYEMWYADLETTIPKGLTSKHKVIVISGLTQNQATEHLKKLSV